MEKKGEITSLISLTCSHTARDLNPSLLGSKPTKISRIYQGFTSQESSVPYYKWHGKYTCLKTSKTVTTRRDVSEKNHWGDCIEFITALKTREGTNILSLLLLKNATYMFWENLKHKDEKREAEKKKPHRSNSIQRDKSWQHYNIFLPTDQSRILLWSQSMSVGLEQMLSWSKRPRLHLS